MSHPDRPTHIPGAALIEHHDDGTTRAWIRDDLFLLPDALAAWSQWFTHHGIDPATVPVRYPVDVDPAARTITLTRFTRDPDTGMKLIRGGEFVMTTHTVHLEAEPLPFPTEEAP